MSRTRKVGTIAGGIVGGIVALVGVALVLAGIITGDRGWYPAGALAGVAGIVTATLAAILHDHEVQVWRRRSSVWNGGDHE